MRGYQGQKSYSTAQCIHWQTTFLLLITPLGTGVFIKGKIQIVWNETWAVKQEDLKLDNPTQRLAASQLTGNITGKPMCWRVSGDCYNNALAEIARATNSENTHINEWMISPQGTTHRRTGAGIKPAFLQNLIFIGPPSIPQLLDELSSHTLQFNVATKYYTAFLHQKRELTKSSNLADQIDLHVDHCDPILFL